MYNSWCFMSLSVLNQRGCNPSVIVWFFTFIGRSMDPISVRAAILSKHYAVGKISPSYQTQKEVSVKIKFNVATNNIGGSYDMSLTWGNRSCGDL